MDEPVFIKATLVKRFVRDQGLSVSKESVESVNKAVKTLLLKASENAKSQNRKRIQTNDL